MQECLFFGLPLSLETCHELAVVQETLKKQFKHSEIKWAPIKDCHITLHFLGDTDFEIVPKLIERINKREMPKPFEIRLKSVDAFPSKKDPKILIVKTDLHPSFFGLYKRLGDILAGLAFNVDERPFVPHITLGRIIKRSEVLKPELVDLPQFVCLASDFVLYRSTQTSSGSVYAEVVRFNL